MSTTSSCLSGGASHRSDSKSYEIPSLPRKSGPALLERGPNDRHIHPEQMADKNS